MEAEYKEQALRVWDEAKLKTLFLMSDGSRQGLTMQEAKAAGAPIDAIGERLADLLIQALVLAFCNPVEVDLAEIKELKQLKLAIFLNGIEPGTEVAQIDAKIALLDAISSGVEAMYVPGGHSGKRGYSKQRIYIHGLCDVFLAITGEKPKVSQEGPFTRFVAATTKHFCPDTEVPSHDTIGHARADWEQSKSKH